MKKKRSLAYTLAALIVTGILYGIWAGFLSTPHEANHVRFHPVPDNTTSVQPTTVHLYFSDKSNLYLSAENRELTFPGDPVESAKQIVQALIDGPRNGLMRTLPPCTKLRALFLYEDGTAFVDFSNALSENHPGGSESELMTLYSIVNSLILNIDDIHSVKILIEGHDSMTLAGHMDLRFPFNANMRLIR